jgi:DnaJ-class molecular chaperone
VSNYNVSEVTQNEVSEVVYAMSEVRTCPDCKGTGVEDQWDEDSGPCRVCGGEGEV